MYNEDIDGSIAHVTMLGKQGIVSEEEKEKIIAGLEEIRKDIADGKIVFTVEDEDIHMGIESRLIQRIGDVGKSCILPEAVMTSELLHFTAPTENVMDTVSDRDYSLEFLSDASISMMHLSRWAEEFTWWNSSEFSYIAIDDSFCTGSSIMPQKKNPDMAELIRGKVGRPCIRRPDAASDRHEGNGPCV